MENITTTFDVSNAQDAGSVRIVKRITKEVTTEERFTIDELNQNRETYVRDRDRAQVEIDKIDAKLAEVVEEVQVKFDEEVVKREEEVKVEETPVEASTAMDEEVTDKENAK